MTAPADDTTTDLHADIAKLRAERDAALAREAALTSELAASTAELTKRNYEYSERIRHQAATIDVLKAMSASPGDPQPVFDLIAVRARDLCAAYGLTVLEYDGTLIHHRAATGVSDDPQIREAMAARFPMPATRDSSAGRAILDRQTIRIDDLETEPGLNLIAQRLTAKSLVAIPLMRRDVAIGALALGSRERGGFSDTQIQLLQTFAEQAVVAINSAETYRALQEQTAALAQRNTEYGERIEQQAATIDVLKVMSASPGDALPVFQLVVERARASCEADGATLALIHGEMLHLKAFAGFFDKSYETQFPRPISTERCLAGRSSRVMWCRLMTYQWMPSITQGEEPSGRLLRSLCSERATRSALSQWDEAGRESSQQPSWDCYGFSPSRL